MTNPSGLDKWANSVKTQSEQELSRAFLGSALTNSSVIDKMASFLLAGVGATTALMISNLDKTAALIGHEAVRTTLLLFIVSGLLGMLQKYLALTLQIRLNIEDIINKSVSEILKNHSEEEIKIANLVMPGDPVVDATIDFTVPLKEIETIVPWYGRRAFNQGVNAAKTDPLAGYKDSARIYNRQALYATAELMTAVVAILVVAFGI